MKIKKIIKGLQENLDKLQEILENREEYIDERSEKWLESEKGENYQLQTDDLGEAISGLEEIIEELKALQS